MRHVWSGAGREGGGGGACGAGNGYARRKEGRARIGRWVSGAASAGTFSEGGNAGSFSRGEHVPDHQFFVRQVFDRRFFDKQFFRKQCPANHGAVILRIEYACG